MFVESAIVIVGDRLSVRDERGEELVEVVWLDVWDFIIEVLTSAERVIDLLIKEEAEPETVDDALACGDSDEDAETLGDEDGDSDINELVDWLGLLDDDTDSSTYWDNDISLEIDCFDERECEGVDVCVLDASDEGESDVVLAADFVDVLDKVIVDDTTMDEDFFDVAVDDGETFADGETEANGEKDSETDEDKV